MFNLPDIQWGKRFFLHFYLNYTGHETITNVAIIGTRLKEKAITIQSQNFPIGVIGTDVNLAVSSNTIASTLALNLFL